MVAAVVVTGNQLALVHLDPQVDQVVVVAQAHHNLVVLVEHTVIMVVLVLLDMVVVEVVLQKQETPMEMVMVEMDHQTFIDMDQAPQ
jgi:hypothetical protein